MIDDTMSSEYPNRNQRYAVCNNLLLQKKIETKQNTNKISKQFGKQVKIAQKKNYPLVYKYYMDNYKKAMGQQFIVNVSTCTNNGFHTLLPRIQIAQI